jgi:ribosome-associated protein
MERDTLFDWIRTAGEESFSRSGGPGGQNVNKVNTKVILRLPIEEIPGLNEDELNRLKERLGNRLTNEGELIVQASEERSQAKNRRRAEERAAHLITEAIRRKKRRRPTKPGKAAKERRLQRKKSRGHLKETRKSPEPE